MPDKKQEHDGHRQRMKDRFLQNGLDGFSDHEVMELILFYALPYKNTNPLAHALIDSFGNLSNVLDASPEDLRHVSGVTPHVATLIHVIGCTMARYWKQKTEVGTLLYNVDSLGKFLLPFFIGKRNELVMLVSLDNRHKLLNATCVFEGSVNSTQFGYRTAVEQALRDNATMVVLAHNHPGGFAIPSSADMETTARFAEVLKLMSIRLLDHLIFSDDDFVSMAQTKEMASFLSPNTSGETLGRVADES